MTVSETLAHIPEEKTPARSLSRPPDTSKATDSLESGYDVVDEPQTLEALEHAWSMMDQFEEALEMRQRVLTDEELEHALEEAKRRAEPFLRRGEENMNHDAGVVPILPSEHRNAAVRMSSQLGWPLFPHVHATGRKTGASR